ncbi:hypothetical protein SCHIN_v1c02570 [Spiroplasma chinense]|uniref:Uncharacterized protein n=1 Tax=Spiroplasma chinense TaxID=216932 RepID=A0A5B9Y312_9MOLU|nr:hypothetical protein [Spiroplasma chinense]QEH61454.1 hypothetical protein SCHIN_v1c02570 [Spiroplasma chinense]
MIKSKTLLLIVGLGGLSTAAVIPVISLSNSFSNTFKKQNEGTDSTSNLDETLDEDIKDSNQGFEAVGVLKIKTNLGDINDLSEQSIREKLLKENNILKDKTIYIKGITLKKVKFTVENYSGTMEVNYKVTDLNNLIKEKELGKIKDIRETTIIEKIKEKNPLLSGVSFEGELSISITSLSEIHVSLANNSRSDENYIILNYKCTSIEGLFSENDLGQMDDISEANISAQVKNHNTQLEFAAEKNYVFKFVENTVQTPSGVKVNLYFNNELVKFDEANFLNITYNVKSIETIVTKLDLGEIESISPTVILDKITSLNPIFANYRNIKDSKFESIGLNYAILRNDNLEGQVTVTFVIKNLSGLLLETVVGDIEDYSTDSSKRDPKIIELVKKTNPILSDLSTSSLHVATFKISSFTVSDQYISNNTFVFSIDGYNGTLTMTFRIKRQSIEKFLKVTDLGNLYWISTKEVIQKIKDRNGADFDESELIFSTPNYTGVTVTAKETSYNYYGVVKISYKTLFSKTTGFNLNSGVNGTITGDTFVANQGIISGGDNQKANQSSIEMKYAIPDNYNNLKAAYKNFVFDITIKPKRIQANKAVASSELTSKTTNKKITTSISSITTSWSKEAELAHPGFTLTFRSRNWLGCNAGPQSWSYSTVFKYQISRATSGGIDYIKIKLVMNSSMSDYSTCDDVVSEYSTYLNSIDIN